MGRFTKIPQSTFEELQLDAGVLLNAFDPSNPVEPADSAIICATTGGINATCVPTFSDLGEDVDNCPTNTKELKHLDSWECKMAFTSLGTSTENIRLALGAADINATSGKITPRRDLEQTDFSDIWWVGDRADGGLVAIKLINALSTAGFSLQTTKSGKGQISVELTGHVSINAQNTMPMEFYSLDPDDSAIEPDIYLSRGNVSIEAGATATITATTVPSGQSVTWSTSNDAKATVSNGVITAVAEGTATITATMTYGGHTYTDTCNVTVTAAGTGA